MPGNWAFGAKEGSGTGDGGFDYVASWGILGDTGRTGHLRITSSDSSITLTNPYGGTDEHFDMTVLFEDDNPAAVGASASAGSATEAARGDHVHAGVKSFGITGGSARTGTIEIAEGANTTITESAISGGYKYTIASSGGLELGGAPQPITDEGAEAAGTGTTASRVDHEHGYSFDDTAPADVASSASAGAGKKAARDDHAHRGVASLKVTDAGTLRYGAITLTSGVTDPNNHVVVYDRTGGAGFTGNTFEVLYADPNIYQALCEDGTGARPANDVSKVLQIKCNPDNLGGVAVVWADADQDNPTMHLSLASVTADWTFSAGSDFKIKNVADPADAHDVATKQYVDNRLDDGPRTAAFALSDNTAAGTATAAYRTDADIVAKVTVLNDVAGKGAALTSGEFFAYEP